MKELALLLMMSVSMPSLRIEPTPISAESDMFTFWAMDSHGAFSNIATVTVLPNVLKGGRVKNETLLATDEDGDVMLFHIVEQGTKGTARILFHNTGEFDYTPHRYVTLSMNGGPCVLQRSRDLILWEDINVFLTDSGSFIDKRIAGAQFYRLRKPEAQAQLAPSAVRVRVIQ